MKALTIWQPWASLLACGAKQYETRNWVTKYRGPIAIHAAVRDPMRNLRSDEFEKFASNIVGMWPWHELPRGAIIATAELLNVWHIVWHPGVNVDVAKHIQVGVERLTTNKHGQDFADYFVPSEMEFAFGNWTPGWYAWELANIKPVDPIPVKGKQGLWCWEEGGYMSG